MMTRQRRWPDVYRQSDRRYLRHRRSDSQKRKPKERSQMKGKSQMKRSIQLILSLALTCCAPLAMAQLSQVTSKPPVIVGAVGNYNVNPAQLTITGSGFGIVMPTVGLDGIPLTILSFSDNMVV